MSKKYSTNRIAEIYKIDPDKVKKWLKGNGYKEFEPRYNSAFANFLGRSPLSLKGENKKIKVETKKRNKEVEAFWDANFHLIQHAKYKESAKVQVDKLMRLAGQKDEIKQKIQKFYAGLPSGKEFTENLCYKKYFTWQDLTFVENGLKANPNICFLHIPIKGPTKILKELEIEYFQKRFSKKLYKVYINRETGKLELLLSDDIQKIRKIVEKHIERPKRAVTSGTVKKHKIGSLDELQDQNDTLRNISLDEIITFYSHNLYIQTAAKLLKSKGRALALWENNNSVREESVLIIVEKKPFSFVIWENINDKRACYIFKYKSRKFEDGLSMLKRFISSEIKYKRENLFRHSEVEDYQLMFEEYRPIIHENLALYKKNINDFVSPYFVLR